MPHASRDPRLSNDGLDTINTTFLNRQLAPEPEAGPFGVCFVAFSGTHNKRYRGERLLEVAALAACQC